MVSACGCLAFACLALVPFVAAGSQTDQGESLEIAARYVSGEADSNLSVIYRSGRVEARGAAVSDLGDGDGVLSVYTRLPEESEMPSVIGRTDWKPGILKFVPRFPFQAGLAYFVSIGSEASGKSYYTFSLPIEDFEPVAVVSEVFPSASELPMNLLKFYLHFSHPMSMGDSYSHIRLLDEGGLPVELPFLELGEELWDREGKRLTLLFDPGRIKSGLKPRLDQGMALRKGERYTLQILDTWKDANGQALKQAFRKSFTAIAPDVESPAMDNWKLATPKANSMAALRIAFPEALDEALLRRVLIVIDSKDREIEGSVTVEDGERTWSFEPSKTWSLGSYRLRVETILEDLAGNSLGRPFEVEMRSSEEHLRPEKFAYLDFELE